MKKLFILSIVFVGFCICPGSFVNAQGIGINSSGNPPDPSAIFDASATDKGILIPRLTTTQRNAISSPTEGLMIFNTTTKCFEAYVLNAWNTSTCPGCVVPAVPGSVSGSSSVCTDASGVTYSISAVSGASTYSWSVPSGATITAGQGTTSISVTFGSTSGNVSVTASSSCGTSTASNLSVTVHPPLPSTPGSITGNTSPCSNSLGNVYSISSVTYASTYSWSVPAGSTITSGQGTTSITVTFGSSSGNISVTAVNGCGTSAASSLAVTLGGSGSGSQTFSYTGSLQTFTIPTCVSSIIITAKGAAGGDGGYLAGLGASMTGTFAVTTGHVLNILVGQQGGNGGNCNGGGGGGSFVVNNTTSTLLIAAGGGGGAGLYINDAPAGVKNGTTSQNGNTGWYGNNNNQTAGTGGAGGNGGGTPSQNPSGGGGGGYLTNGANGNGGGGKSYLNGGAGGTAGTGGVAYGGYGGGGGGECNWDGGGGGGGYSGGGGGYYYGAGGGGGSYNTGTSQFNVSGTQSGNGQVVISW